MSKEREAIVARLRELQAVLKSEKRSFSPVEKSEIDALSAKLNEINNKQARNMPNTREDVVKYVREAVNGTKKGMLVERTADGIYTGAEAAAAGITPQVINPLTMLGQETIFAKVGIPFQTGCEGDIVWPYLSSNATVYLGTAEGSAISDSEITITKKFVAPERIAVSTPVSNIAIARSANAIVDATEKALPYAFNQAIDKILFTPAKLSGFTAVQGPLVGLTPRKLGVNPAWADITALKGDLFAEGVNGKYVCWVMSEATKAKLEATPKNAAGGDRMICEDGKIDGYPVYTTSFIQTSTSSAEGATTTLDYIAIGSWNYCPTALFGNSSIVVDPISNLRKGQTDFILDSAISCTTVASNAFKLGSLEAK